jgi:RNA polymerase-binding transcription factor DksA
MAALLLVVNFPGSSPERVMTSSHRLTYADSLRRAREQRSLTIAATRAVIDRRNRRHNAGRNLIADIEAEIDQLIVQQEEETLAAIETALRRLREMPETFGVCVRCGAPLEAELMNVEPWATICGRHEDRSAALALV